MRVERGIDAAARKRGERSPVAWDRALGANAHCLLAGLSGAGKTRTLRRTIDPMRASGPPGLRFHVFDARGDSRVDGASEVRRSKPARRPRSARRKRPKPPGRRT